jgi:uncharacterized protein YndB with AHSA1/START domain
VGSHWRIDVFRHADAPRELVWSLLEDHRGYSRWNPYPRAELEQEGEDATNGVGAIRFLGAGPVGAREQVLDYEPPQWLAYTILSGVPVRGYRADVLLTETADRGTDIRWTGGFESAPPGMARLLRGFLDRTLQGLAGRLAREAERRAAATTSR